MSTIDIAGFITRLVTAAQWVGGAIAAFNLINLGINFEEISAEPRRMKQAIAGAVGGVLVFFAATLLSSLPTAWMNG